MNADKVTEVLVTVLKAAQADSREQRLYKSGKLEGLFPSRHGLNGEAAALAVREQLLEVVRTEQRGKTTIEWVRPTPRCVEFLHQHESPVQLLQELRAALHTARQQVPGWLEELQRELQRLGGRLDAETAQIVARLDGLSSRVDEALQRLAASRLEVPQDLSNTLPWAADALQYLERRRSSGAEQCPLPELFAALTPLHQDLAVLAFQNGLRRLKERRVLRLYPFTGVGVLPQPELRSGWGSRALLRRAINRLEV